ncbi:MAG: hypothetical protein IPL46_19080 [Saprospiraceae bacterium]|nr:hypothetical protein [Saprospiraceae bacterium]
MKNHSLISTTLVILIFALTQVSFSKILAQTTEPSMYVQFDYMKSKSNNYPSIEKDIWKPIHEHRIRNRNLVFWGLYEVTYPSGTKREYDYVTINLYLGIEALEDGMRDVKDWIREVHQNADLIEIEKNTLDARDLVWSETFEILSQAFSPKQIPGQYVMANRMKVTPGREPAYEKMEKEIYLPAHKIAADQGLRINWHFLKRFAPRGTEYGYNYMTLDVYDHLHQMIQPLSEDVWHSAHPGRDLNRFFAEIDVNNMRELTRGEVWKLVTYATRQ